MFSTRTKKGTILASGLAVTLVVLAVLAVSMPVGAEEPQWVGDRYDQDGDGIDDAEMREAIADRIDGEISRMDLRFLVATRDGTLSEGEKAAYFVHKYTNRARQTRGHPAVDWDATLANVAEGHSNDMAERDFYNHTNPDGDDAIDRIGAAGHCQVASENIDRTRYNTTFTRWWDGKTVDIETPRDLGQHLVHSWLNSSSHRENLLGELEWEWQSEGVGVAIDGTDVYATQNFADCDDRTPEVSLHDGGEGTVEVSIQGATTLAVDGVPQDWTVRSTDAAGAAVHPGGAGDALDSAGGVVWFWREPVMDADLTIEFQTPTDTAEDVQITARAADSDGSEVSTATTVTVETDGSSDADLSSYDQDGDGTIDTITELQPIIQAYLSNDLSGGLETLQTAIQQYLAA